MCISWFIWIYTIFVYSSHFFLLSKQLTKGDPESSITNVQIGSYTNPAFEIENIQNEDAVSSTFRSTDGLQNDGGINQKNDTQPKNEYENVGSTDHPDTSNGYTTHWMTEIYYFLNITFYD